MADFPDVQALESIQGDILSVASLLAAGSSGSTAWPSANLAIFVPVRLAVPRTVYKIIIGAGSVAGGNFDVGIYDSGGNRLVSSGATARSATTEHVLDITDTVIGPGTFYLAMAADGTDAYRLFTPSGTSPVPLQKTRLIGVMGVATSYVLPATVTFAAATLAPYPQIIALLRPY